MPPIFVLVKHGGPQGGLLIGLYEDRSHALGVAASHAFHRLRRCKQIDESIFGVNSLEQHYEIAHLDAGSIVRIGIRHRPSGENDAMSWTVEPRTVIPKPTFEQPELPCIFEHTGRAS